LTNFASVHSAGSVFMCVVGVGVDKDNGKSVTCAGLLVGSNCGKNWLHECHNITLLVGEKLCHVM